MTSSIPLPLRSSRVHEASGPAAHGFAAVIASGLSGPLFWVREGWRPERLVPQSLERYFDPSLLLFAETKTQAESLAVGEEALRDGVCPLVVMELFAPLTLTEGRRLQLAAKAGGATGLCLIPETVTNNTAETRWRCGPLPDPDGEPGDSTLQRWALTKNKTGTLGVWDVRWDAKARRLIVVSASRE